jgi:hypothetical protein
MATQAVTYHRLTPLARVEIQGAGLTVADYVRRFCPDGQWTGDRCGCTDDRCVGFHHDEHEDCGCLPVLIRDVLGWEPPAGETVQQLDAAMVVAYAIERQTRRLAALGAQRRACRVVAGLRGRR